MKYPHDLGKEGPWRLEKRKNKERRFGQRMKTKRLVGDVFEMGERSY